MAFLRCVSLDYTVWICNGNGSKDGLVKISLTGLNDENLWLSIKRRAIIEIELVFQLVDVDRNTIRTINGTCTANTYSIYFTEQKISILKIVLPSSPCDRKHNTKLP